MPPIPMKCTCCEVVNMEDETKGYHSKKPAPDRHGACRRRMFGYCSFDWRIRSDWKSILQRCQDSFDLPHSSLGAKQRRRTNTTQLKMRGLEPFGHVGLISPDSQGECVDALASR
jgi:hypothetical protein